MCISNSIALYMYPDIIPYSIYRIPYTVRVGNWIIDS